MSDSPILWKPPQMFDEDAPGLGLPQLQGIDHSLLYDPAPCRGNVDEGGNGRYESLLHGTFNHHQTIVVQDDTFIVYWTNHSRDENGPGQRILARVGTFSEDRERIDFDGEASFVEMAPPPIPVRRRVFQHDPDVIYPYATGALKLIEGSLYFFGNITACHGYTRDEKNRRPASPLPEADWSDDLDIDRGFFFDVWFNLGLDWVQRWKIEGGRLVPASPMYAMTKLRTEVEVTPGRVKRVAPLLPPYTDTVPFDEADSFLRDDVVDGIPVKFERTPNYRPNTSYLSADGKHALAHHAEFRRPDGSWVVIRDNLLNHGHYYAAEKPGGNDFYPPAVETNLYGGAQPIAGELPDGRPWIICNSYDDYFGAAERSRKDMFITISDDGRTFDRSWLLLHIDRESDGGVYKFGGPQYFKHVLIGENLWVVYSITKEQIGLTKIPVRLFD